MNWACADDDIGAGFGQPVSVLAGRIERAYVAVVLEEAHAETLRLEKRYQIFEEGRFASSRFRHKRDDRGHFRHGMAASGEASTREAFAAQVGHRVIEVVTEQFANSIHHG